METRLLSDLNLNGKLVLSKYETAFPDNPAIGTLIIKDNGLYAYITIGGLSTWYPFANKTNSYIHTQGLASDTWTVTHNLGSSDVWIQIQDTTGNILSASKTTINANSFTLNFTSPALGNVVVVAPDDINVPVINATLINVGSGVVIGSNSITVDSNQVLTTLNQTTLQNSINAEITRATNAETTISSNIGTLGSLTTTAQSNLVAAINEVNAVALNGGGGASTAQLNAEITRAMSVEDNISASVLVEKTRASNAESTISVIANFASTEAATAIKIRNPTVDGGGSSGSALNIGANAWTAPGDSYIVRTAGYFKENSSATPFYAKENDWLVYVGLLAPVGGGYVLKRYYQNPTTISAGSNISVSGDYDSGFNISATVDLSSEATLRQNADATLQANLNTEITRAQNAEASLVSSVNALGNAFVYINSVSGGIISSPTDLTSLTTQNAGAYYKVSTSGYFYDGASTLQANLNDGLVWNLGGTIDIIDNTNSAVFGTTNQIAVSGSSNTGYTVSIDGVFSTRLTNAEATIATLQANIDGGAYTGA